jgi:hypothetical protein
MSTPTHDEPAFPVSTLIGGHQDGPSTFQFAGLTKREYFAGLAMQGMACQGLEYDAEGTPWGAWEWVARESVKAADSLIAALNAEPQP